jgi:hypothetical protein
MRARTTANRALTVGFLNEMVEAGFVDMVICRGRPMASAMPTASFSPSVFVRRKFLQQVRPVASHDTAYFVIDDIDVVERPNLQADPFKVLWAERAAVQEFHWHTFAPPRGRRHRVQPGDTGIGALPGHQEHRKPSKRLPTEASGWRSKVRISIARLVRQPGQ